MNERDTSMTDKLPLRRVWVVRAGKLGKAHSLFLEGHVIALEGQNIADLRNLPSAKRGFTDQVKVLALQGGAGPSSLGHIGAQFYAFIHEIQNGDIVVYPATNIDGQVWLGRVLTSYQYSTIPNVDFPHHRQITWLKNCSRAGLRGDVLKEINAFYPLFQIKRNPKFWEGLVGT